MNKAETNLRKKQRSYRSARVGCVFLFVISIAVLIMVVMTDQTDDDTMTIPYTMTFFWPAMAYICHLKLQLIDYQLREQTNYQETTTES